MSFALQRGLPPAGTACGRRNAQSNIASVKTVSQGPRLLVVVAGEARSANRTKWTRKDAEQLHANGNGTAIQQQSCALEQLQDADTVHDLVRKVKTLGQ